MRRIATKVECTTLLSQIQDAVRDRDAQALGTAAHSLTGSVGCFVAQQAFEAARHLEELARKEDLAHIDEAFQKSLTEIERLSRELAPLVAGQTT